MTHSRPKTQPFKLSATSNLFRKRSCSEICTIWVDSRFGYEWTLDRERIITKKIAKINTQNYKSRRVESFDTAAEMKFIMLIRCFRTLSNTRETIFRFRYFLPKYRPETRRKRYANYLPRANIIEVRPNGRKFATKSIPLSLAKKTYLIFLNKKFLNCFHLFFFIVPPSASAATGFGAI